jgi:hypothetical protein
MSRFTCSDLALANVGATAALRIAHSRLARQVYDDEQRVLVVRPFTFGMHAVEIFLRMDDTALLQSAWLTYERDCRADSRAADLSTSPEAESPHFAEDMRNVLKFMAANTPTSVFKRVGNARAIYRLLTTSAAQRARQDVAHLPQGRDRGLGACWRQVHQVINQHREPIAAHAPRSLLPLVLIKGGRS